jgi:thiamine monophosphate synthase
LDKYTKKKVVALGGISKKNIKQIKLTNVSSIAGISYFR